MIELPTAHTFLSFLIFLCIQCADSLTDCEEKLAWERISNKHYKLSLKETTPENVTDYSVGISFFNTAQDTETMGNQSLSVLHDSNISNYLIIKQTTVSLNNTERKGAQAAAIQLETNGRISCSLEQAEEVAGSSERHAADFGKFASRNQAKDVLCNVYFSSPFRDNRTGKIPETAEVLYSNLTTAEGNDKLWFVIETQDEMKNITLAVTGHKTTFSGTYAVCFTGTNKFSRPHNEEQIYLPITSRTGFHNINNELIDSQNISQLNESPLIETTDIWPTGRKYLIAIPVDGNFTGYAIDLLFTKPVDYIKSNSTGNRAFMVNSTHWIVVKQARELVWKKEIKVALELEYKNTSDIKALNFNGKALLGDFISHVINRSENFEIAKQTNCSRYLKLREDLKFLSGTGKSLQFETQLYEKQIGVVVDFIFEHHVKEVKSWIFRASNVNGLIWRVENTGWIVSPNDKVTFSIRIESYDHYHVKIKGIMINGKILCGLGTDLSFELREMNLKPEMQNLEIHKPFSSLEARLIIVNIVLTSVIIVVAGICFPIFLIQNVKKNLKQENHHKYSTPYSTEISKIYEEIL